MPLSTFDLKIPKAKVLSSYTSTAECNLLFQTRNVAGVDINVTVTLTNTKQLYVYYHVELTDIVTDVELQTRTSIVNENGNKCKVTLCTRSYHSGQTGGWGPSLDRFATFGSIERYIVGDTLTIRVEIKDLVRKPDDQVLLQRIYRATNAREQALVEARIKEQQQCNTQQEETISVLQATVESLRSQLEKKKKTKKKTKRKTGDMDSSAASSAAATAVAEEPVSVDKLDDQQLNALQEAIMCEKKKRSTCVVCMENPVCITFIPCGHRKTCAECAEKLDANCPICRQAIEKSIKTF